MLKELKELKKLIKPEQYMAMEIINKLISEEAIKEASKGIAGGKSLIKKLLKWTEPRKEFLGFYTYSEDKYIYTESHFIIIFNKGTLEIPEELVPKRELPNVLKNYINDLRNYVNFKAESKVIKLTAENIKEINAKKKEKDYKYINFLPPKLNSQGEQMYYSTPIDFLFAISKILLSQDDEIILQKHKEECSLLLKNSKGEAALILGAVQGEDVAEKSTLFWKELL